jgi:uncharacterized membrane protein
MNWLILAIFYWLHLIATVVWIGGIFFILFAAIPSAKQVLGVDAGKLMGEISRRFTPMANYCIVILAVTGIALMGCNKHFSGLGITKNSWVLILKHILVLGMVGIHFYRGLVLNPRIGKIELPDKKASLQRLSLNLVKTNLALGLLVLFLSAAASLIA